MKQWSVRLTSAARQDLKDIGGYIKYNLREPETSKKNSQNPAHGNQEAE